LGGSTEWPGVVPAEDVEFGNADELAAKHPDPQLPGACELEASVHAAAVAVMPLYQRASASQMG
jgi:hypothetical protein